MSMRRPRGKTSDPEGGGRPAGLAALAWALAAGAGAAAADGDERYWVFGFHGADGIEVVALDAQTGAPVYLAATASDAADSPATILGYEQMVGATAKRHLAIEIAVDPIGVAVSVSSYQTSVALTGGGKPLTLSQVRTQFHAEADDARHWQACFFTTELARLPDTAERLRALDLPALEAMMGSTPQEPPPPTVQVPLGP
jgi:hypothetical protein